MLGWSSLAAPQVVHNSVFIRAARGAHKSHPELRGRFPHEDPGREGFDRRAQTQG